MHDRSVEVLARVRRAVRDRVLPARHRLTAPVEVTAWEVPGEPVSFAEAVARPHEPFAAGRRWGRPWATTWLHVTGEVPAEWAHGWDEDDRVELVCDLGFGDATPGFQAEGLAHDADGRILSGLHPRKRHVRLPARPGEVAEVHVEAASNPDVGADWSFAPTPMGDLATVGDDPLYTFGGAHLAVLDRDVFHLERDLATLLGLVDVLPATSTRRARIIAALERAVDVVTTGDLTTGGTSTEATGSTAAAARAELAEVLSAPAAASAHHVVATGHAHLDSAWLWPVRETVRKCARTFANVLELLDDYPEFVFVASSAQQYAWVRDHHPELFARIRAAVADGRFVPVGGMWVEADTNLPGGEGLVRQFLLGKQFFLDEFGVDCTEVWLPDSFGYSAGLPQVAVAAGCRDFLTQKTSWNDTNTLPHHTFWWEGVDGTRIFTHFPPVDTYGAELSSAELDRAARQHAERGVSDRSLVPFGWSDGGGGPTREMLEQARRVADLEGSPTVAVGPPSDLFDVARAELGDDAATWSGELYLEFHRGTYTSQARTKAGNRRNEHLLREAELWATTATLRTGVPYPADRLRAAWEWVLLGHFHDILPGSSIAWVHREAEAAHARVTADLEDLVAEALAVLAAGDGGTGVVANAGSFPVHGVRAMGAGPATAPTSRAERDGDQVVLTGRELVARIDGDGGVVSLVDRATGREVVPPGEVGNLLEAFHDRPNRWDAWDLDQSYRRLPRPVATTAVEVVGEGDGAGAVVVRRRVGASTIEQRLAVVGASLEVTTTVDWQEDETLLKLAFPVDVHTDTATSEVQFGHLDRPIHTNTSWDAARFETCAQRWVRVAEPGFGVTLANDATHGHDVTRQPRDGGGTFARVRASLLRAPRFPDPDADRGTHTFRHALVVGDLLAGVAEAHRLNLPPRPVPAAERIAPLVVVDEPGVVVAAVKLAEDGSGDLVVRCHEARGARTRARLAVDLDVVAAARTDLLERDLPEQPTDPLDLDLRPFELVTVRICPG